jgi:glycosyltransferase involved in cell wall biosynthesis
MIVGLGLLNQAQARTGTELFEARVGAGLVRLSSPWRWRVYTRGTLPPEWQGLSGYEVCVLGDPQPKRGRRLWVEQWRWGRELARRPVDLVVALAFSPPWRTGVPFVLTVHDLAPLARPQDYAPVARAYWRHVLSRVAPGAVRLCVPSEYVRQDCVARLGFPADRIDIVHNGIEAGFFHAAEDSRESDDAVLERLGVRRPFWFHCGTVHPRKNLEVAVDALGLMAERGAETPQLVSAGDTGAHAQSILRCAGARRVSGALRILGPQGDSVLRILYRSCAAFVFPSWSEGFGVPPLEAMATGAPVIAARATCLPEILGDAAEWADPAVPESWLQAWERVHSEDPSAAARRRARGIEWARQYTWEASARQAHATVTAALEGLRR